MRGRQGVATVMQVGGIGFVSWAAFKVSEPLGLATVGAGLVVFGLATERGGT